MDRKSNLAIEAIVAATLVAGTAPASAGPLVWNLETLAPSVAVPWGVEALGSAGGVSASSAPALDGDAFAFRAVADPSGTFSPAVVVGTTTGSTAIATVGTEVPGSGGGVPFEDFRSSTSPGRVSTDGGAVAFAGQFAGGSGVYVASTTGAGLDVVADTSTATGAVGGETFSGFDDPRIRNGVVVFHGQGNAGSDGIYAASGGVLTTVADTTTVVPGRTTTFQDFGAFPSLDDDGAVAFWGSTVDGSPSAALGIYRAGPAGIEVIADDDTPIPGGTANFRNTALSPSIDDGQVTFVGGNASAGELGVYTGGPGTLRAIADRSTAVPDGAPGETFTEFGFHPTTANGNVAFTALGDAGTVGLYAEVAGSLVKVVDQTDAIDPSGHALLGSSGPVRLLPDSAGVQVFHQGMSGNAIAFVANLLDDASGPFPVVAETLMRATLGLDYQDFSDPAGIVVNGDATVGSTLQLTDDAPGQAGSAFFGTPWRLGDETSFSSRFDLVISGQNDGGPLGSDGLAFVIHGDPEGASAIGNSGEGIGFGTNLLTGSPESPIAPSLALELDTHRNAFDPDDNHVALIVDGDVTRHLAGFTPSTPLNSGLPISVLVNYDGRRDELAVFLSTDGLFASTPSLLATVDLHALLGPDAFFGFTAGTGDGFNRHEITRWSLTVSERPLSTTAVPEPGPAWLVAVALLAGGRWRIRIRRQWRTHPILSPCDRRHGWNRHGRTSSGTPERSHLDLRFGTSM
ncbi:MAG: hypothetical protein H6983_17270 [Ectothiorhodospiraceae bacterium]|nr:hypothetical protein [Ectothiorhodospiraceae bacterium]